MLQVSGQVRQGGVDFGRRRLLQVGALGTAGLRLPDFFRLEAQAGNRAAGGASTAPRNVILFWMSGGPGHMETWDPKPEAVDQYRGPFGAIQTSVPGVQFGELLPEEAKLMDRVSIVRSVRHGTGDHTKGNHWMLTGFEGPDFNAPDNKVQRRPALGSAVSRLIGPSTPGMPPYVAVPHLRGGTDNFFHYATYLGGGANPFVVNSDPSESKYRVENLSLPGDLSYPRLESRRHLLESLDDFRARADQNMADMDDHQQRAFQLLTSTRVREAFDITQETPELRDTYGRHTVGQSALLARRLVERGVTFVTVNSEPWDHHGTANRFATEEGARKLIPSFDVAISALIRDLVDRGMYEQTLVVAMGEFGRTPRMNSAAGRDHWGHTFSVLFGGGNLKMGQIVGASTARGEYVAERPVDPQDVAATIYQHLGIDARSVTFPDRLGRPMYLLDKGEPIRELIG